MNANVLKDMMNQGIGIFKTFEGGYRMQKTATPANTAYLFNDMPDSYFQMFNSWEEAYKAAENYIGVDYLWDVVIRFKGTSNSRLGLGKPMMRTQQVIAKNMEEALVLGQKTFLVEHVDGVDIMEAKAKQIKKAYP